MERMLLVVVHAPGEDVDRLMQAITAVAPLAMGRYDSNAWQSAPGTEHYRPLEGAAAGAETEVCKRPGIVELRFELPEDQALVERVIEAIFEVHSYQEPVIRLLPILTSRSKGLDDSTNPHRWWNTTGDWKIKAVTP
jgi:hypothetical protein